MELQQKLNDQGWYLTYDGIKKVVSALGDTSGANDVKKIIGAAMNMDFREIAGGALPSKREDSIAGHIVLQVQKVRNVSAPKSNEESRSAPRLLQLELTDGQGTVQALELEPVPVLNINVAPGTKIYFSAARLSIVQGYLILKATELELLGGRVEALVEKWELARAIMRYARSGRRMSGASGPPPWVAFGKKLDSMKDGLPNERNFRSLQAALDKDKESKENEEFNSMRSEAIATAAKAGNKKVFGGGTQQILDHNVKKILEKGYSEDDAKQALRTTNNNLERALFNLKRRLDYGYSEEAGKPAAQSVPPANVRTGMRNSVPKEGSGGGRRGAATNKEEAASAKPQGNVSLFDFLTDKLPANSESAPPARPSGSSTQATTISSNTDVSYNAASSYRNEKPRNDKYASTFNKSTPSELNQKPRFENNISSSFNANRFTGSQSQPRAERTERVERSERGGRGGRHATNNNERPLNSSNPFRTDPSERERDSRNAAENSRYSNFSGRGGSSNRGGRTTGSYQAASNNDYSSNRSRNSYDDDPARSYTQNERYEGSVRVGRSKRGGTESSSYQNHNNASRNIRPSYERAAGGGATGGNASMGIFGSPERATPDGGNNGYINPFSDKPRNPNRDNAKEGNRQQPHQSGQQGAATATGSNSSQSNNNNKSNDYSSQVEKLVDSTAKLKIEKGRERDREREGASRKQRTARPQFQQQQQNPPPPPSPRNQPSNLPHSAPQQQQQQQQQYSPVAAHQMQPTYVNPHMSANQQQQQYMLASQAQSPVTPPQLQSYQQLPNGYTYDPTKIIGFQSKETNEYAMSILKSQGLGANAANANQQQQYQQPPPSHAAHHAFVPGNGPASPLPPQSPYGTQTMVLPSPPPPSVIAVQPPPSAGGQYGMLPADNWAWQIGDLCLAKYWDDGRYYEAEITAISDKTCVVFFLGYGNHEEVLKSDCLPITDANHQPINSYQPANVTPNMQQQAGLATAAADAMSQQQHSNPFQRGSSQRLRGERQVYVPPHKREH